MWLEKGTLMEKYDISDIAYADSGLESLTIKERDLFERTITAVGMPRPFVIAPGGTC